jgi:hypothetical protein
VIAGFRREEDKNCVINQKCAVLKTVVVVVVNTMFAPYLAT